MSYKTLSDDGPFANHVCSHTDYRFQHLNKQKGPKCPYCDRTMNIITRRVWKGPINGYFHIEAEIVCSNPQCPFIPCEDWDTAYKVWKAKEE